MNIKGLKNGTKLIWDAPEPYKGYSKNPKHPGRVFYPAMVVEENNPKANELGVKIKTLGSTNWMGFDNENLRFPTSEELLTEKW
jgi:hypothetical protein